ncbi:alpha/beta-hydrolase [Cylindrobasidium torrendii FP15055 ss-10]|uniref:Alpha/beta-hydrolase n=1 Tax=Cylindrobasidium torrendii FP15055 ss-10 TaxID=1314674 RepID=A0A0D7BAB2_9AGAR|nr:alpha/beta-hydrolase [Cylindrobasidium torrendii FP15055 ss-10]
MTIETNYLVAAAILLILSAVPTAVRLFGWQEPSSELQKRRRERKLPGALRRIFLNGPAGRLEVVTNKITMSCESNPPPILFVHGAFGTARCWDKWMEYMACVEPQRRIYALSLRGHGQSCRPVDFNWATTDDYARDVAACCSHIGTATVLVAHSAGGCVAQYGLAHSLFRVHALVLVGAVPPWGAYPVYMNWLRLDWTYIPRYLVSGGDIFSMLCSPALVQKAFFSDRVKKTDLDEYWQHMNKEESMALATTISFVTASVEKATGANERVHIIAGRVDKLMSLDMMLDVHAEYAKGNMNTSIAIVDSGHNLMCDVNWVDGIESVCLRLREWDHLVGEQRNENK